MMKMSEVPGSDPTQPPKMTPETPEQKLGRLSNMLGIDKIREQIDDLNKMQNRLLSELGNTNQNINAALEWIKDFSNKINQAGGIPQRQQTETQQQPPAGGLMQMMQGGVSFKDVAEAIRALKGNDQPQTSEFAQLGQQMVTDLIRATVDDIQQRVYGIRKLPPPNLQGHALE